MNKINTLRRGYAPHLVKALFFLGIFSGLCIAQSSPSPSPTPEHNPADLAKKLANPIASLISLPFQSNLDHGMGADGSGWKYTLNIQPVIPMKLNPKWNLISRTIVPVIHQNRVVNNRNQSGLGDTTQSFFFSPADSKKLIWGVGPALLIPTATNKYLGTQKFGVGPTVVALKQHKHWTGGVLANHIWSVAGKANRSSVSSTFLQPFVAYTTKTAWTYNLDTESTYDWVGNQWSVPVAFTVSKLVKWGRHPVSLGGAVRCWAAGPPGGPNNCSLRLIITPVFPT